MRGAFAALMAFVGLTSAAMAQAPIAGDERFAAVTVATGEGVAAIVSNVTAPPLGGRPTAPCPVMVEFFTANGKLLGTAATVHLRPGASISVPAAAPTQGLVRAQIAIIGDDPDMSCAIRSDLEVYELMGGAALFVVPGSQCLGRGTCVGPLQ